MNLNSKVLLAAFGIADLLTLTNADCSSATLVSIGSLVEGTTTGAAPADLTNVPNCFTDVPPTGPGMWFQVNGTGNTLTVDTCGSVTSLTEVSVFSGSCGSNTTLVCKEANEKYLQNTDCGATSSLIFDSVEGERNYIFVHSTDESGGDFSLSVKEVIAPNNDMCIDAIPLPLDDEESGSTRRATIDNITTAGTCGDAIHGQSPGVWYAVNGTGTDLVASLCGSEYDTQLSIFTGSSCDSLVCVNGNDDSCDDQSNVLWSSEVDTTYYVLVHGDRGASGVYTLSVKEASAVVPAENVCTGAQTLTIGTPVQGTTVSALADASLPVCSGVTRSNSTELVVNGPGVWYQVTGTGKTFRASTCGSFFDTQLAIFSGPSCDSLRCITGNDDDETCPPMNATLSDTGETHSRVRWNSIENAEYYVYVTGSGTATGDFNLMVEEIDSPDNDACSGSLPVTIGQTISGSIEKAIEDNEQGALCLDANNDDTTNEPGLWYSVVGTGSAMAASGCSIGFTEYYGVSPFPYLENYNPYVPISDDAQVLVYSGQDCNGLTCVASSGSSCTTTWDSTAGVVYQILIRKVHSNWGQNGVMPNYLHLTVNSVPDNDKCSQATPLKPGVTITDTTEFASTDSSIGQCGTAQPSGPGVWYSMVGTGNTFVATTCVSAVNTFNTQISIFEGSCENEVTPLTCVDGNDDYCDEQSAVTWVANFETTYYIYVHGSGDGELGQFSLLVDEVAIPSNDDCAFSLPVEIGVPAVGTIDFATMDEEKRSCVATTVNSTIGPGVWHTATGTGGTLVASACSGGEHSANTLITVFLLDDRIQNQKNVFPNLVDSGACGFLMCLHEGSSCSATWESFEGATYYILVEGDEDTPTFGTNYQLTVSGTSDNDECTGAVEVQPDGSTLYSSTTFAKVDMDIDVAEDCGGAWNHQAPGVWYSVVGTGATLYASLCDSVTTFDTQISIFEGTCGGGLVCVDGNDDSCDRQSNIQWKTKVGITYYILVHGYDSETGPFGLSVGESSNSNEICINAQPLSLNATVSGNIEDATVVMDVPECDLPTSGHPGFWFSIIGTGNELEANLCGSEFDTQVSVLTGSCSALDCVASNDDAKIDDACSRQSVVRWDSELGAPYFIFVSGYGTATGNYSLIVA